MDELSYRCGIGRAGVSGSISSILMAYKSNSARLGSFCCADGGASHLSGWVTR